ncbi:DivIVA domain-containing protein [Aerococcaceae bacterium WGS1372]
MGDISSSLFGYNKGQVDLMLNQQNEKIKSLENKISELENQLQSYVEMESALKEGIVDARAKGSEIINEATIKADQLINETNEQLAQRKEDLVHHGNDLLNSGIALKHRLDFMKDEMRDMIDQVSVFIEDTDFDRVFPETEIETFRQSIKEYSDGEVAAKSVSEDKSMPESSLSEEEKRELEKLIHEVIANDASAKEEVVVENTHEKKLINLRTLNG